MRGYEEHLVEVKSAFLPICHPLSENTQSLQFFSYNGFSSGESVIRVVSRKTSQQKSSTLVSHSNMPQGVRLIRAQDFLANAILIKTKQIMMSLIIQIVVCWSRSALRRRADEGTDKM